MGNDVYQIERVLQADVCSGCGGCGAATQGAITIPLSAVGMYTPQLDGVSDSDLEKADQVCPFSNATVNESEIGQQRHTSAQHSDSRIGRYHSLWAGRIESEKDIIGSSSGGLTTWIAKRLLSEGKVDGVIHVGPSDVTRNGRLIEYRVSRTVESLIESRKSNYYPTSFSEVLNDLSLDSGERYAFVGLPCQCTSIRHLQKLDDRWNEAIPYVLGIVCGHLKSARYAESLAWQLDIEPSDLSSIDFRVKDPSRSARGYGLRVEGIDGRSAESEANKLVGGNWGHASFQPNACNYCDDIFAESADVCLGDAWLPKYESNWRGTNVVIIRHPEIADLLSRGRDAGEVWIEELSADEVASTQDGNFRHRRVGLSVRAADDAKESLWRPIKRVNAKLDGIPENRIRVTRARRRLGDASHKLFADARSRGNLEVYISGIRPLVVEYEQAARQSFLERMRPKVERRLWKYWNAAVTTGSRIIPSRRSRR
ncbi:Coenzyme F420 hydrogenase/dehydrogenase, beta subunit C-terminal domain [Rhodococcus pyridinivorans]|uniref:Coenzyme F420 hydrogenase/dehydrogenase, beta subunit C-terminal domain n=1 Tax=Rhodococcus pyridinivorans TaxID=103816 RepID=UPI00128EB54A|nr:Coenzyme F420 hydrogenase/dehydrogenase, beta subunit C-terminal domain [Rhodococcus pyridinivorans]